MYRIMLFFAIFSFLASCKKDKLNGEYAILEGRWDLSYIVKRSENVASGIITYDTTYANQLSDQYAFEFLKKGQLRQIKNDKLIREDRIVFQTFTDELPSSEYDMRCVIRLNNDDNNVFVASFTSLKMSASKEHVDGFEDSSNSNISVSHSFIYSK